MKTSKLPLTVDDAGGFIVLSAAIDLQVLDYVGTASFTATGATLPTTRTTAKRAADAVRLVPVKAVGAFIICSIMQKIIQTNGRTH